MKYNIIILCTESLGGTKTFLFNQALYLKSQGHTVGLFCNKISKYEKKIKSNLLKIKEFKNLLKSKKLISSPNLFAHKKSKKIILLTNPFLLISQFIFFNKLKNEGVKIILSLHSGILEVNIKRLVGGLMVSLLIFNKIDLIYGSDYAKKSWEKFFPWMKLKKSRIVLNGITLKKTKYKKRGKKFIVGFVGRYEKEKNPILFGDVAVYASKQKTDIQFKMFGYGSMTSIINSRFKKFVKIFGWTHQEYIYKNINALLVTSPKENYPYSVLEAKSYGIPTIYTSKGDIKKIISNGKDGIYCKSNNPKDILRLIAVIKKKYPFFVKNCNKNIKKFKLEKSCKLFWKNHIDVKYNNR